MGNIEPFGHTPSITHLHRLNGHSRTLPCHVRQERKVQCHYLLLSRNPPSFKNLTSSFPYPRDGKHSRRCPLSHAHTCGAHSSPSHKCEVFSTPSTYDGGSRIMIRATTKAQQPQHVAWTLERLVHE